MKIIRALLFKNLSNYVGRLKDHYELQRTDGY